MPIATQHACVNECDKMHLRLDKYIVRVWSAEKAIINVLFDREPTCISLNTTVHVYPY